MTTTGLFSKLRRQPAMVRLWSDRTLHLLGADTPPVRAAEEPELAVRINDMAQIERYEAVTSWQSTADFVALCKDRIAKNILVFTYADATGPLLGYGIAAPNAKDSTYPYVQQHVIWPQRTANIYGGFVHPGARGRGIHTALQNARIRHLTDTLGMEMVISAVTDENAIAMRSAQKAGLRPIADLRTRYRFGRAVKTVWRHDDFALKCPDVAV